MASFGHGNPRLGRVESAEASCGTRLLPGRAGFGSRYRSDVCKPAGAWIREPDSRFARPVGEGIVGEKLASPRR